MTQNATINTPLLNTRYLASGMRIIVACSGGADSVALLRTLLAWRDRLGIVLSVAHLNHRIRGAESDGDEAFVRALAAQFDLAVHPQSVDTPGEAAAHRQGLEESARNLRYAWFWKLLAQAEADVLVTAHTLDDQAETVVHRLLRGAWTEGLSGIHPVLRPPTKQPGPTKQSAPNRQALIVRPFLDTTREQIEAWLKAIQQPWRQDSSNLDLVYTRNRIRHDLLPKLGTFNPEIRKQLAQLAVLARDEDAYWQAELSRLLPTLFLPGRAVRGGGRATNTLTGSDSLAIEIERLRSLHPALRRRIVRTAVEQLGGTASFADTERLLSLCGLGDSEGSDSYGSADSSRLDLSGGLRAERTPRELRLLREPMGIAAGDVLSASVEYTLPVPGVVDAPAFGLHLDVTVTEPSLAPLPSATLRASRPGDRVTLRYSRSPLKIKEALQRARLPRDSQPPMLEWQGEIVWVKGLDIESKAAKDAALVIVASPLN
ncbi:tRNA(Ile)-lysidine synthetase [Acidisarcina polymorpha]|uniref:tRNA(Ile)-lysidine synthase n=1 Tax=Acidisarcina polymorpha TaxID=2211140 RepID=A0A2Z5G5X4_9BACT|nr:tRNA lysidine(34) synthetase TilS [Acidisarcina polymorpha]AXC14643.1 tRNA(Ile)-lysidine synthetase [Acidisarcina polymorpha]